MTGFTCEACGTGGHVSLRRIAPAMRGDDAGLRSLMSLGRSPGILVCPDCVAPRPIYPSQVGWVAAETAT